MEKRRRFKRLMTNDRLEQCWHDFCPNLSPAAWYGRSVQNAGRPAQLLINKFIRTDSFNFVVRLVRKTDQQKT